MRKVISFTRIRYVMIAVSVIVIVGGAIATFSIGGFNLGIDFQAGLSQRVAIDPAVRSVTVEEVRSALAEIDGLQVNTIGVPADQEFAVRVRDEGTIDDFGNVMSNRILEILRARYGEDAVDEVESSYVGPRFSADLARQSFVLIFVALFLILAYIAFRFRVVYALSAIAALVHDVAFMLVFIGLTQIEVSTATMAAVLTIIGYSLNDTIVIFDRIRENEHTMRDSAFPVIIDTSITQSLSRTVITSITTLLAVTSIYVFATGAIQDFALNLIVGVIIGTYSSIFIASPFLLHAQQTVRKRRRKAAAKKPAGDQQKSVEGKKQTPETVAAATGASTDAILRELGARKSPAAGGKSPTRGKKKKKK